MRIPGIIVIAAGHRTIGKVTILAPRYGEFLAHTGLHEPYGPASS